MRISVKINAAFATAFALGTLATALVLGATIRPMFEQIEREAALVDHRRVTEAFEASTEKLATAAQDYAFWDETYGFMHGEGVDDFITSNLTPEYKAVANLGVNALVFVGLDGSVKWGAAYELEAEAPIPSLVSELAELAFKHPNLASNGQSARGFVRTSAGLVLAAVAPVHRGDHSGEKRGHVVSARLFDAKAIADLTGVQFTAEVLPPAAAGSGVKAADGVSMTTLDGSIRTSSSIAGVTGEPLLRLDVSSDRHVSQAGAVAIKSAMLLMALVALGSMSVLWLFLRHTVVARIVDLKQHFAKAGSSGRIELTGEATDADEIGDLARSFNSMAGQVNHLRDAIADSAYMSGLSEWAAGTLHNIVNGLTPVKAMTWQSARIYSGPWLRNVETAAAEHAAPETSPERRRKLNAFLVGSASRLADAARQTESLNEKIEQSAQDVLDMVAEFERYAHRKTETEPVELLPLVGTVAKATLEARWNGIELVLPVTPAAVQCNRIILRQIVANVLINSAEAMHDPARRARIEIAFSTPPERPGMTRITITDNGEGVAADQLTAIFKRGVSTRKERSGGLGLHWCANAVKVFGGAISAESAGPGHGTAIMIDLPSSAAQLEEAA